MKKTISVVVVLALLTCFAATLPPGAVGKKIPDYANLPSPPSTYMFLVSDPGGNYFNLTVAQLVSVVSVAGPFLPNINGNGTNEQFWGVTGFDELDTTKFYPTNLFILTNWPPAAPTTYGEAFAWNSNGTLYNVQSKVNALTWTKTNLVSAP